MLNHSIGQLGQTKEGGDKNKDAPSAGRMGGDNKPALAIVVQKEIYDKKRSDHFKFMMKKNTEPEKNIRLRKHLAKFDDDYLYKLKAKFKVSGLDGCEEINPNKNKYVRR